jgi:hypothetical protein
MKLYELNKFSLSLIMQDVNNSFANQSVLQMLMNFIEKNACYELEILEKFYERTLNKGRFESMRIADAKKCCQKRI